MMYVRSYIDIFMHPEVQNISNHITTFNNHNHNQSHISYEILQKEIVIVSLKFYRVIQFISTSTLELEIYETHYNFMQGDSLAKFFTIA